jgi:hypothetical protein
VPLLVCDFERDANPDELCCPTCSWRYYSTSSPPHVSCSFTYHWEVFDNLTDEKLAELDSTSDNFLYAWPYKSEFRIKMSITETCGRTCSIEKVYFDEDCFEPCEPTGGGGAPPYKQEGYVEAPCDVIIKKVYIVDERTHDIEHIVVVKDVWVE